MKLILAFLLSYSAFCSSVLLNRIENEVEKDLGTKLTVLAYVSEERNPSDYHKLCVVEDKDGNIAYVLNYDTTLKELSLVDELASHHVSNKQIWTIERFAKPVSMVTFYGTDAIRGKIASSKVKESGTILTLEYLYTVGEYRDRKFLLAKEDNRWRLFKSKDTQEKPVTRIHFRANKNWLGMVTGIKEIELK